MGKMVLKIEEIAPDRDTVEINGKSYELLRMDDFSLSRNAEIRRLGDTVTNSMNKLGEMDSNELCAFEGALNSLIGKIVKEIPDDVVAALSYKHRTALLMAFWQAVAEEGKTTAKKERKPREVKPE